MLFTSLFFACIGLVLYVLSTQTLTVDKASKMMSKSLTREVNFLERTTVSLDTTNDCTRLPVLPHATFIYKKGRLVCWSDNKLLIPEALISDSASIQLLKLAQSNFILYQRPIGLDYQVASLLMLTRKYPIQNSFLKSEWNDQVFPTNAITILEPNANLGIPIYFNDQILFRVSMQVSRLAAYPNTLYGSVFFAFITLVFITLWLFKHLHGLVRDSTRLWIICLWILAIRLLLLLISYPQSILSIDLFSPAQFTSSWLNPTLGDLMINIALLFFISLFLYRSTLRVEKEYSRREPTSFFVVLSVVSSFILFNAFHLSTLTIQTVVHNSLFDYDITKSLQFPFLRLVAIVSLLVCWSGSFLCVHLLFKFILKHAGLLTHRVMLVGAFCFGCLYYFENQLFWPTLLIGWVYFILVFHFDLLSSLERIQYKTFSYLLLALVGFVVNASITIYILNKEEGKINQWRFADSYLSDQDTFGEFLLNDLSKNVASDVFIQTRLASPFLSKVPIQQKVRQIYLPSYFNKYDIEILLFNSSGINWMKEEGLSLSNLISSFETTSEKTPYQGVFRINRKSGDFAKQYMLLIPINRNNYLNGYVVLVLSLKKTIPENVYPELLVDNRFRESLRPDEISFASFYKGTLMAQSGDFDYSSKFSSTLLGESMLFSEGIEIDSFQHIAVEDANENVTVVSSPIMSYKHLFTNAAFYMVLGLVLILVFFFVQGIIYQVRGKHLFLSARIQLLLNLSFLVPLVIVSIVTLQILTSSSQSQLDTTYMNKVGLLAEQMSLGGLLQDSSLTAILDSDYLQALSKISNSELFLFEGDGKLLSASHYALFDNQLLGPVANRAAAVRMSSEERSFIVPEKIGSFSFFMAFAELANTNRYVAIPFYQSSSLIQELQIEALSTILVVFVFVLLALLVISYFVSRWLTFPLQFISTALQQTSLSNFNEPLVWNSTDEIGLMVQSYNSMLQKMKDSMLQLERMQREQAWREIAQQVAHEIKNPLTPMKLTLQRLSRSVLNEELDSKRLSISFNSLLEQIELLNTIASSFSTFAKLPAPSIQRLDLRPIVDNVLHLYAIPTERFSLPKEMWASADAVMMQTVFSNIVLNAIQAKHPSRPFTFTLVISKEATVWKISCMDNGIGISDEKRDKIFLPHFTTKQSGSGLGLAISKRSLDLMGGSISFTSVLNEGTTFVLEIPIAD